MEADTTNILVCKDKDLLYFDISYIVFYRYYATLTWYKKQIDADIDISTIIDNKEFIEKYSKMFIKCILELISKYNIIHENTYLIRDSLRENIWRYNFYKEYKGTRDTHLTTFNKDIFKYTYNELLPLYIKDYKFQVIFINTMEADDIIAVMCKYIKKKNTNIRQYIITNDNDYIQLCDANTIILNLQEKEIKERVEYNPQLYLEVKIIKGDTSDNIQSIAKKVGPKTAYKLASSPELLQSFLDKNQDARIKYELNRTLIDFNYIPIDLISNLESIINFI